MATITSNGTGGGLWSAGATWAGGSVPVDNDAVVIASGDTVTFDVDQSGFADGIAGITITGTLKLSRSSGTYYLKLKAATTISGAGTFDCGTSGDKIPFTAKHTLTGGENWRIDGNLYLALSIYGTEPTYKYVKLSAQEDSGQTALSVDTDVTGDIWAVGDSVAVVGGINNSGNYATTTHTITDISSTEITVTPAINAVRVAGSYIVLLARNVSVLVGLSSNQNGTIYRMRPSKLTIGGGYFTTSGIARTMLDLADMGTGSVISGGVFYGDKFVQYITESQISDFVCVGSVFLSVGSNRNTITNVLSLGNGNDANVYGASNRIVDSTFAFLQNVNNGFDNYYENCLITNTGQGVGNASFHANVSFVNCTFQNNNIDNNNSVCTYYNCLLPNTQNNIENLNYGDLNYTESFDHNQVAGAYARWMLAGRVDTQNLVLPAGYTLGYKYTLANTTYYFHHPINIVVLAGAKIDIEVQLRKTVSMAYLPRAYLMKSIENPIVVPAHAIDSFTMTDSTDTWESDTFTIDNSAGTYDKNYTLWFVAKNASGNVYSAYKITAQGGGGGSVKILPIGGRVGL